MTEVSTDVVRLKLIDTIEKMLDEATHFDLPGYQDSSDVERLRFLRERLIENTYTVLVMGEVKRGKSTFVNALIGREILPTDVDVATSQVFFIQNATAECCRLRYEDGTSEEISFDELSRFGSQVVIDAEGEPELSNILRWIEIDVPARFLPPNVRLLDTPGLGTLYSSHARITMRLVPLADAVVFVLASGQPITAKEIEYLEQVLEGTSSVFFVQTKIDQHRAAHWQDILERNRDILHDKFDADIQPTIWPISSTNLIQAGLNDDEDYLFASQYPELSEALDAFLYRVSGWGRSVDTLLIAGRLHSWVEDILQNRLNALNATDDERETQVAELEHNRDKFIDEWGSNTVRRQKLRERINDIRTIAHTSLHKLLMPGGTVDKQCGEAIYQCDKISELEELAETFSNEMSAQIDETWQSIEGELFDVLEEEFGDLINTGDSLLQTTAFNQMDLQSVHPELKTKDARNLEKYGLAAMKGGVPIALSMLTGQGISATVNTIVANIVKVALNSALAAAGGQITIQMGSFAAAAKLVTIGLGVIAWAPTVILCGIGIYKFIKTLKETTARQLQEAQDSLYDHLNEARSTLYSHFLESAPGEGRLRSHLDELFYEIDLEVNNQIDTIVEERVNEVDGEIVVLQEQLTLDVEQRQVEAERIQGNLFRWQRIEESLKEVGTELSAVDGVQI